MSPVAMVMRSVRAGRGVGSRMRVVGRGPAARAAGLGLVVGALGGVVAVEGAGWLGLVSIALALVVGWVVGRGDAPGRDDAVDLDAQVQSQTRDLRASRARLAHGADAERRRIERDLHDGCQQRLIALRIKLGLAEELIDAENERALLLIEEIAGDAESALEELQTFVHGVYPSLLVDRGLDDALKALARSAAMQVRVRAEGRLRYPAEVEAAVYFACAEALQNVAKHAGAVATACVALRHNGSGLAFEVSDNGDGFGDDVRAGAGLTNMEDRLNAVGGHLLVTSAPGRGTTVEGWVDPVQALALVPLPVALDDGERP
jgi:signal transduction histidine kinase